MTRSVPPRAVIKVGGSLLDWPELPIRVSDVLRTCELITDRVVIIAGGGSAVDVIRELDRIHRFGEKPAHQLAIDGLELTARILERILTGARVASDQRDIQRCWADGLIPILAPGRILEEANPAAPPALPFSWEVTSDSIAAWIATRLGTDRLILLKSSEIPAGSSRAKAATAGLVDPYLTEAARNLKRVEYWNLRNPAGRLIELLQED
jgi:aspartokinase-like uncharacterized kinase